MKTKIVTILILTILLSSCSMFFHTTPKVSNVDFYSKTVEYNTFIDDGEDYYNKPVATYCYGKASIYDDSGNFVASIDGALVGKYTYEYEIQNPDIGAHPELAGFAGLNFWVLRKMNYYTYSYTGTETKYEKVETLQEYFKYEYGFYSWCDIKDSSETYIDEADMVSKTETGENFLTKTISYSADGTQTGYYEVTYELLQQGGISYQEPKYRSITEYVGNDTDGKRLTSYQASAYNNVGSRTTIYKDDGSSLCTFDTFSYLTEIFYDVPQGGTDLAVSNEFACFYNSNGQYTHELYASRKDSSNMSEIFTKYDRDTQGRIYTQQDFSYDIPDSFYATDDTNTAVQHMHTKNLTGSGIELSAFCFTNMKTFVLDGAKFGDLIEKLEYSYDEYNNINRTVVNSYGQETERNDFRYNDGKEVSNVIYYNASKVATKKIETRYNTESIDGTLYTVKETIEYHNYDVEDELPNNEGSDSITSDPYGYEQRSIASSGAEEIYKSKVDPLVLKTARSKYMPIRSNHEH